MFEILFEKLIKAIELANLAQTGLSLTYQQAMLLGEWIRAGKETEKREPKLLAEIERLRRENTQYLSEINSLANIIIDATKGYVSSNDLDRANDAIDLWISKQEALDDNV